jgi:hypothetical protein
MLRHLLLGLVSSPNSDFVARLSRLRRFIISWPISVFGSRPAIERDFTYCCVVSSSTISACHSRSRNRKRRRSRRTPLVFCQHNRITKSVRIGVSLRFCFGSSFCFAVRRKKPSLTGTFSLSVLFIIHIKIKRFLLLFLLQTNKTRLPF